MSDNEIGNHRVPNETTAEAAAGRTSEETRSDPKSGRKIRMVGWLIEASLLGWTLARSFFAKPPLPGTIPPEEGSPAAALGNNAQPARLRAPEKTGRDADSTLDLESPSKLDSRRRWGTLFVGCAFVIGSAAGLGFLIVYWSGGNNLWLGGTLALFFAGFGAALIFHAHWLMVHKEAVEPREKLPSSTQEREAVLEDYCASARDVQRRSVLKWMGAAGTGILAAMVVSLFRSLGMSPYPSLFTTVWKRGQRLMTEEGKPVSINALQPGSAITVFPENSLDSEKAQTVLIRVKEQFLQLPKDRANWAPQGYVAYSRVCTHAGCPVGMFEAETNLLLCPCHQSTFDVLRAAVPTGGPAARPLPQLPLYADSDGNLRAGGGFTSPVGPGFWGGPS